MRSRARTPGDDRRIRELEGRVAELEGQLAEIQPPETGLLAEGKYNGRIVESVRKISRSGKYLWTLKIKIEGRNRHVWYNIMERGMSPLEMMCRDLGVYVREQAAPVPIDWGDGGHTPAELEGKPVVVEVGFSRFQDRTMNDVKSVKPR